MTARSDVDRHDDPSRERKIQWAVVCAVAVVIAAACGVVASSGEVPGWEEATFHAINDLPDWLEAPMWVFQLAGLLFVPLVVAVGAAAFRRWRLVAALVVFVPLKLIVEKLVVKQLVERERPGTTICGAPDDFDETCGNFRGDVHLDGLSFVSGHAIIAWGVATLLWPVLPGRWRWLPVVIAALNAIARVYLGAHNPLDVIGGGAVGVAIGAVLVIVFNPADTSIPFPPTRRNACSLTLEVKHIVRSMVCLLDVEVEALIAGDMAEAPHAWVPSSPPRLRPRSTGNRTLDPVSVRRENLGSPVAREEIADEANPGGPGCCRTGCWCVFRRRQRHCDR